MIVKSEHVVKNVIDIDETFEGKAPTTKEHLAVYCAIVLESRFPHPSHCKDHVSPLDAIWAAYAELDDFSIWYAMRGSGKTYNVSLLGWLESVFKPNCLTTVLGGSLEQSTKAVAYLSNLWDLPRVKDIRKKLLVNNQVAGRGFKTHHGSSITALAASSKSVRGPHPQKLRLDELDEMDRVIYEASLGQPKSKHGISDNIVISSTLHKAFGLMTEVIDEREKTGAQLYKWCVEEVREPRGFWTNGEIERKKRQLTVAMYDSEYLLKRPQIGDTIFDFESVDRAYQRAIKKNIKHNKNIETEAGIDWGYSCTVLQIMQDRKEYFNNVESYSWEYVELTERCEAITKVLIEKKVTTVYCDSNPKDSHVTLKKTLRRNKAGHIKVIPVSFNAWKDMSIDALRFLLERDLINIRDKTCQDKMKKYHYKDPDLEIIEKKDDHYPDALIAWASSKVQMFINTDTRKPKEEDLKQQKRA